jgi:alcohol dehydrogenase
MPTNSWRFHNPTTVIFESGAFEKLGQFLPYERAVLITSATFRKQGFIDRVASALGKTLVYVLDDVKPNPDLLIVDAQITRLRSIRPDVVIALGGGSSIDTAKALARMLVQPPGATLRCHFRDQVTLSQHNALPVIAIPTTSGTGSEVTPFATIWDFELGKKYSVIGEDIFPHTAILDPELTYELPEEVTISTGLDAISHALESIWNRNAYPVSIAFATESLTLSLPALRALGHSVRNHAARADIMQASLLAGLAISQTRTALAHSISYPLTTDFGLPHGIACSFTLPALLRFNLTVDDGRLTKLAKSIGYSNPQALADDLAELFGEVCASDIFERYIPKPELVMNIVDKMITPGRADNNIRKANLEDIEDIVFASLPK